jgi:4-alpha-glucanotransferase
MADALAAMVQPTPPEAATSSAGAERQVPRASGILLHLTSLPARFGIGDLGDGAFRFVDFLASCGQQYWQVMPLGPTGYGDSPYQTLSAFAGNPLLISLEGLTAERCLAPWELDSSPRFDESRVDYSGAMRVKQRLLRLAFDNFLAGASTDRREALTEFVERNRWWLEDYSLFAALKAHHSGAPWSSWERSIAGHESGAVAHWSELLASEVRFQQWVQYIFHRQWDRLRKYAGEHGVSIIGDVPIFAAYDSADVWSHQELFQLDAAGRPRVVAGVPPDYFSPTGQLWGNPLYDWDAMARDSYTWWIGRLRQAFQLVDVVRLDHFRGFEASWAVPVGEENAVHGRWLKGPGAALFRAAEAALGPLRFIAEDLGVITPEVEELRELLGLPGMKVLQFAFSGEPENPYLPYNYEKDCVVYTGTHDNDTAVGWLLSGRDQELAAFRRYLGSDGAPTHRDLIRLAQMSVARVAITPLQDVLGIGSEGRMNTPGRATGDWGWRFTPEMLTSEAADWLREITETSGRTPREGSCLEEEGGNE